MGAQSWNGKTGEVMRMAFFAIVSALVAYYTTLGTLQQRVAAIESTEKAHFEELMRAVSRIETDVRDVKRVLIERPR